jgi:hypothetical protein
LQIHNQFTFTQLDFKFIQNSDSSFSSSSKDKEKPEVDEVLANLECDYQIHDDVVELLFDVQGFVDSYKKQLVEVLKEVKDEVCFGGPMCVGEVEEFLI